MTASAQHASDLLTLLGWQMTGCWDMPPASALLRAVILVVRQHTHGIKYCCNTGHSADPGDPAHISPCCQAFQCKQIVSSFYRQQSMGAHHNCWLRLQCNCMHAISLCYSLSENAHEMCCKDADRKHSLQHRLRLLRTRVRDQLRMTLCAHQPCCCPGLGVDTHNMHFALLLSPSSACWQRFRNFRLLLQLEQNGWLVSSVFLGNWHQWCCQLHKVLMTH